MYIQMKNKINTIIKNIIKQSKLSKRLPIIIFTTFIVLYGYASLKQTLIESIQMGYIIPNTFINSVVVALDGFVNPDGVIANAVDITRKVGSGKSVLVEDVFRRCEIQSENRVSKAYFQLYDTKTGVNQGEMIGGSGSGQEVRDYLRWKNRASLDLEASQMVGIVSSSNPDVVADFIIKNNEDGFIPIIRLGIIDLGVWPFDLTENSDSLVTFYQAIGERLMNENKGYRAVISFGPNEPHTNVPDTTPFMGVNYATMVQRQNQAADRLQKFRVKNGGPFWFAPSIFNGTESFVADGKEYSYDIYHHLYIGGVGSTDKNYWTRPNIDPALFDAMLVNVYSAPTKTAWEFYRDFGLKEYVDGKENLVTVVTEFGATPDATSLTIDDLKDDFKQLYDDQKIEGINWFRAIKDMPSIPPQPQENQRLELSDFITFTEQANKNTKKISLKVDSWLNCNLSSTLYTRSTSGNGGTTPPLNIKTKGGLNEGTVVGGDFSAQISKAKEVGLSGFTLGIATSPGQVDATVAFINQSISSGMVPIVRLCYLGSPGSPRGENCSFDLSGGKTADVVNFYKSVAQRASGSFIGIIGPNEPGTGFPEGLGEMKGFGLNSYDEAVASANKVAAELQGTPKMLIAPAAFNLINPQNNDFEQYRSKGLNASLFDVIIGNAYNIDPYKAATAIDAAASYAKSNGMKFIVTETGNIAGRTSEDFKNSVSALCQKVDGFLMFRSVQGLSPTDGNYENKPQLYSTEELKSFARACGGGSSSSTADTSSETTAVPVADELSTGGSSTTANACTGGLPENQIIFVGDSLTDWLGRRVFSGVPEKFEIGEPGASTYWFMPGGQKGNTYSDKVKAAAADTQAKALFLMLGTNDCGGVADEAFRSNLTAIVNYIKAAAHPDLDIYLSTIPNYRAGCSPEKISSYNNIIRSVQSSTGVSLRDVGDFVESDTTDGVHLTNQGYERIANITRELLGGTCPSTGGNGESGPTNPGSGGSGGAALTAGSTALACGVEQDKPATFYQGKNAAALRVRCAGGSCTTKKVDTVDIEAPIKLFASNSPNGTLRNRLSPVSQIAAAASNNPGYDALNMFAGEIKVAGKSYAMPGLGSATNSSFTILRDSLTDRFTKNLGTKSTGSLLKTTQLKLQSQLGDDSTIPVIGSREVFVNSTNTVSIGGEDTALESIDDRTVCFDGECYNNDSGLADWRKNMLPYDPSIAYPTYYAPKACQSSSMKFVNNLDNYITGPEMILKPQSTVFSGTTQDVCWLYSGRNLQSRSPLMSGDGVKTCGYIFDTRIFPGADINATSPDDDKPQRRVFTTTYDPLTGRNITTSRIEYTNWTCKELFDGVANPNDSVEEDAEFANVPVPGGARLPKCDFDDYEFELNKGQIPPAERSGNCDIQEKYQQCLRYDPQESDQVYIHTDTYESVPKVSIPEMYSAIYGLYDRLQTILSQRNAKIVFQENIGMKLKVNSKIRDANKTIASKPYSYSKRFDDSILPELISNTMPLASNNSTKTQYQYFDDLGYVDVLQELITAYSEEHTLLGDHIIDNPFLGGSNIFPGRTKIMAGGTANVALGTPILTCDQVEICKRFTVDELASTYGENMARRLCPLKEKIPSNENRNCITFLNDDRFEDEDRLKDQLCQRGFPVDENCNFQCSVDDDADGVDDDDNDDDGGDPPIAGTYPNTACPVADTQHRCFQGPYGTYTHGSSVGLPLDLYPNFTGGSSNAANRDKRIVAPEDGEIIAVINEGAQGTRITLKGKSGLTYYILHLNGNDPNMVKSGQVRGGQRIAEIASQATVPGLAYNDRNIHAHVRAEYNGKDIDPYFLFGQILKCNATKPNDSWPNRLVLNGVVSNPRAYCVISSGNIFQLNDNGPDKARQSKSVDPDTSALDNNQVKSLFDAAYGSTTASVVNNNAVQPGSITNSSRTIALASTPISSGQVLGTSTDPSAFKIRIPVNAQTEILPNYGPRCFERTRPGGSTYQYCDYHTGIDIAEGVDTGTSVVAAESGRVIKVGREANGYGNYVRIVHPNGMSTLYAHNSTVTVAEGACVRIGQEIAKAGSTGNSTGPHVHLELRKDPNCTISDYSQTTSQNCAVNPSLYMDPNKTTSYFTEEELRTTCDGELPDGEGPDEVLQCVPTDDSPDVDSGETYGNVFSLLERIEEITGVDKYYLAGILSLESGPELQRSVGDAIKNGTALYKGDPTDIGNPNPNSAGAVGPFQFICRTGLSYFYPPNSSNLPCQPWSAGSTGRYYNKVLSCVKALGMSYNDGDILDPKYFGVGACGAATMFSGLEGQSISSFDINSSSARSNANPFWRAAGGYNGGGNFENIPISKWYADSTVGRAFFFKKYWNEYKSGDKGSDCKPSAYKDWYFYHVSLGIECISRGPQDGQCRITTESALNNECQR